MIPSHHLAEAIALACPGRPFALCPEEWSGLQMLDDGPMPTLEEVEAAWAARVPPAPPPITPRQLRLWLHSQGLLEEVPTLIAALPADQRTPAEIEWTYASAFDAAHPLVQAFAAQLELTTADLHAAWRAAALL